MRVGFAKLLRSFCGFFTWTRFSGGYRQFGVPQRESTAMADLFDCPTNESTYPAGPASRRARYKCRGGPTEVPDTDALKDFKRAAALQATPDQVIQFRRLTKSTEVALKGVQDLLHLAESASKPDLFHYANPLTSAVEEAQTDNGEFLHSFSTMQKSGLKDVTKMLGKADSDVAKQRNALAHTLGRSGIGARQIAGVAEELDKALREFQARQLAVGVEMGIQGEGSPQ